MASNLVKRYTDYRVRNEQIKARQRREREKELAPFLIDIGQAVEEDRHNGHSVLELSELLDNSNRNFLYAAVRAFKDSQRGAELDIPAEPVFEPRPEYEGPEFNANRDQAEYYSDTTNEYWGFMLDNGTVVNYPEGIAERFGKPFLKELIAEVEREAAETN